MKFNKDNLNILAYTIEKAKQILYNNSYEISNISYTKSPKDVHRSTSANYRVIRQKCVSEKQVELVLSSEPWEI